MGEVFLAQDDRLRREVAIKRIRSGAGLGPADRERLRREARAAAALSHPAIVQVYDIVEDPSGDSIVMEFVEGETLASHLAEGTLSGPGAIKVLLQVADGLGAAHSKGFVHRDLKSENVILDKDGNAKILDFGVAKSTDAHEADHSLTVGGMAVGTLRSMSPEQCEAKPVDARSDLFSLGVLMYEVFGGRSPFLGKTPVHTMANVVGFDPPPLAELNRSVPGPLSEIVTQLLEKEPSARPDSAVAVADRLEQTVDPKELAGIVIPRLSVTPDSGIDPVKVLDNRSGNLASAARRRRPGGTVVATPHRRSRVPLFVGLALAAVLAIVWLGPFGDAPSAERPARVLVFPLASSVDSDGSASLGEDVATLIGHALDGVEPLRWIDGWPLLDPETRSNARGLELSAMADLAREQQCSYFVWGRVVRVGDSARVFLDLHDLSGGEAVASASAGAPLADAWRAGLRAVNGLLPQLIETEIPDVEADFGNRPPDAVALFLLGEAALRRANFREALEHFQDGFELDSTFAVAGIRGAQAASWVHEPEAAAEMVEQVIRLPMEERSRRFTEGIRGFSAYDAEAAIQNLEAAVDQDPSFTVAWAQLGETYRHLVPRMAAPNDVRPFEQAQALDSLAGYVLFHRLEELIREGDLVRASELRDRFRRGDPDKVLQDQIDVMYTCMSEGPNADWSRQVVEFPWQVLMAAAQLGMGGRQLPCAEALYREILVHDTVAASGAGDRFWNAVVGLSSSLLARGEYDSGRRMLEAAADGFETFQALLDASTTGPDGVQIPGQASPWQKGSVPWRGSRASQLERWSEWFPLVAYAHPDLSELGDRAADELRSLGGPNLDDLPYRTSLWALGFWAARQGQQSEANRAAERLREIAGSPEGAGARNNTVRMAEAVEAHAVLASGDTAAALEAFRALPANAPPRFLYWELVAPLAVERLELAKLEVRLGDPDTAYRLVRSFEGSNAQTHLLYLPTAWGLCVDLDIPAAQTTECRDRLTALGWTDVPAVSR